MSHAYRPVSWTPFKRRYDRWVASGVLAFLVVFYAVSVLATPAGESFTPVQILIRATGSLAFLLLCFVLSIGPLARLTPRFRPLLYNRRHLGVTTCLVALVHASLVTLWYHGFGDLNPLVSLLVSNPRYDALGGFPFESLGLAALLILLLMAATSHDFWNNNLGPRLWKSLHMLVYLAFVAVVAHVALGALQFEKHGLYAALLLTAVLAVAGLHLITGWLSSRPRAASTAGWLPVAAAGEFTDGAARIVQPQAGEAIAVFRHGDEVYAVSNVCRHQAGPLGEGRIVDGCITCPWHGFQYRMRDGCSPPPFNERIATYATRVDAQGIVWVNETGNPPGTEQAPSKLPQETTNAGE